MEAKNTYKLRMGAQITGTGLALALIALSAGSAKAQAPTAIGESGLLSGLQGISTGVSFLFNAPSSATTAPSLAPKAPITYGVTENFNVLSPGQSTVKGLGLTGAALYSMSGTNSPSLSQKQALDQTLSYNEGSFSLSAGYLDVGKYFAADTSTASSLTPAMSSKLLGEKGQNGFNTGLNYNQSGTKFGLQFSTVADSVKQQNQMNETLSMERDFDKSLSLGFQSTQNTTDQLASATSSHLTTDVLHLAYSPTRTGFLLDAKSTSSFSDQGAQTGDLQFKVAQKFSALNLSSQFESSTSSAPGSTSAWMSQRYDANETIKPGLTFTGFWAKKTIASGVDSDDYDVILKAAETRYLTLSAEYAKHEATDQSGTGNQSLVATVTPGSAGPLGPLQIALSINNQQSQVLDGYQNYSASLSGQIASKGVNLGLNGAKYVLAYTDASAGGSYAQNGHAVTHSARTLRIVPAPSGKDALTWSMSQQQRLDQNGQTMRTASNYEAKYRVNTRLSLDANSTFETVLPNGTFTDLDTQGLGMNWNASKSCSMIAQYVHSRCPSQNIADEDGYTLTYSGPALDVSKVDLGVGQQTKYDFNGQSAVGTTANVAYAWKADESNLVNISSKLTDWQNHGFNNDFTESIEATGQINFQRLF